MPGGRFELPTNPESFRGCSTAEDGKSRGLDFSFALMNARFRELHWELALLSLQQFQAYLPVVSSLQCGRANAV